MAYRKTEKVLAKLEAQRARFLAAGIDLIASNGMEALTVENVVFRAEAPVGLFYRYFPDKIELRAAIIAKLLSRDIAAIRAATSGIGNPVSALAAGLRAAYGQIAHANATTAVMHEPVYFSGMVGELAELIEPATGAGASAARMAAGTALGAICGAQAIGGGRATARAQAAVLFALRGIGIANAPARALAEID